MTQGVARASAAARCYLADRLPVLKESRVAIKRVLTSIRMEMTRAQALVRAHLYLEQLEGFCTSGDICQPAISSGRNQ